MDLKSPMWWVQFFLKQGLLLGLAVWLMLMQFGWLESPQSKQTERVLTAVKEFTESVKEVREFQQETQRITSTQQAAMAKALEMMASTQKVVAESTAEKNMKFELLLKSGLSQCRQVARFIAKSQDQYEKCDDWFSPAMR